MQTKTRWIVRLSPLALLLAAGLAVLVVAHETQATRANPLALASDAQIEDAAVKFTETRLNVVSGVPVVRVLRHVTSAELPALGFQVRFSNEEPPLALVILQGDFDVSNLRGVGRHPEVITRVRYIAYVYDLWAGYPALIQTSPAGGEFAVVLNDASLPRAPQRPIDPNAIPGVPQPALTSHPSPQAYGSTAPTVTPPVER